MPHSTVISRWRSLAFGLALTAWLCSLAFGFAAWERFDATPGRVGVAASDQPDGSPHGWRLVMYVHPHCPCSRVSLHELAELVATSGQTLRVEVVFVRPPDAPVGWERSDQWKAAEEIPGAIVRSDVGGAEARRAGAETSGQVVLYEPNGRVAFAGGITAGRGRLGESLARRSILAIIAGHPPAIREAPVFGCELFSENSCPVDLKGSSCPK
jgi:hypothetical protein